MDPVGGHHKVAFAGVLAGGGPPDDRGGLAPGGSGPDGGDLGTGDQFGARGPGGLPQHVVQPPAVNTADGRDSAGPGAVPGSRSSHRPAGS